MSTSKRSGSSEKLNLKKVEIGMTEEDWDYFDSLYQPSEPIRRVSRRGWSDEDDDN